MTPKAITMLYVLVLAMLAWTLAGAQDQASGKERYLEPTASGSAHRLRQQEQRYGG